MAGSPPAQLRLMQKGVMGGTDRQTKRQRASVLSAPPPAEHLHLQQLGPYLHHPLSTFTFAFPPLANPRVPGAAAELWGLRGDQRPLPAAPQSPSAPPHVALTLTFIRLGSWSWTSSLNSSAVSVPFLPSFPA